MRRIERASGDLASEAMARVEATLPWFRAMSAEDRSWITLVAQRGIGAFVDWSRKPDAARAITSEVFGSAPRELARGGHAAADRRAGAHHHRGGRGALRRAGRPRRRGPAARGGPRLRPRGRVRRRRGLRAGRRGARRVGRPPRGTAGRRPHARRSRRRRPLTRRRPRLVAAPARLRRRRVAPRTPLRPRSSTPCAGPLGTPASTWSPASTGTSWSASSAARSPDPHDPVAAAAPLVAQFGAGSGRRRPGRRRPRRNAARSVAAARAGLHAVGRLAAGAASGLCRRPAARARPRRRRRRQAGRSSTTSTDPWSRPEAGCSRPPPPSSSSRPRSRRRPEPCSSTPTRSVTACGGSPR